MNELRSKPAAHLPRALCLLAGSPLVLLSVFSFLFFLFCSFSRSLFSFLLSLFFASVEKKEFKAAPGSKQEKNKPKGGKAKDEKRAADKLKTEAKKAALMGR